MLATVIIPAMMVVLTGVLLPTAPETLHVEKAVFTQADFRCWGITTLALTMALLLEIVYVVWAMFAYDGQNWVLLAIALASLMCMAALDVVSERLLPFLRYWKQCRAGADNASNEALQQEQAFQYAVTSYWMRYTNGISVVAARKRDDVAPDDEEPVFLPVYYVRDGVLFVPAPTTNVLADLAQVAAGRVQSDDGGAASEPRPHELPFLPHAVADSRRDLRKEVAVVCLPSAQGEMTAWRVFSLDLRARGCYQDTFGKDGLAACLASRLGVAGSLVHVPAFKLPLGRD